MNDEAISQRILKKSIESRAVHRSFRRSMSPPHGIEAVKGEAPA